MAVYRASGAGGGSSSTGNRSVAFTPAIGDLLVVAVVVSANTNDAPTMSDNQSGTYTLIQNQTCDMTGANADRMSVFVRDQLCANTNSHTITAATGSNTAGELVVVAVSRMTKTGSTAVRSSGKAEGAAAAAPSAALNQSALTTNLTLFFAGSADTTTTAPTNWTEAQDASQTSPTTACEAAYRDTGFTGTTITAAATQSTAWACIVLELDGLQEGGGNDTLSTSDSATREFTHERTPSDTIAATSDSATTDVTFERNPAVDTVSASDTHEQDFTQGGQTHTRENSDSVDATDGVSVETDHTEEAADTIETADSVTADLTLDRTNSDAIDIADTVAHEEEYDRTFADTIEATDSAVAGTEHVEEASDSIETSDSLERTGTYYNRGSFLVLEIVTTL